MSTSLRRVFSPAVEFAKWYERSARKHPFAVGFITSGVKTCVADIFAQKVVEGRKEIDWTRNFMFTTFGFIYLGGVQYVVYNKVLVYLCGPITSRFGHIATSPIKTFIDQCIHHPLGYFPVFYFIKGIVEGWTLQERYERYQNDLWENMKALWTVWVPAQLVNFATVPRHMRVPYVAAVSFVWTVVISVKRGSTQKEVQAQEAAQIVLTPEPAAPTTATLNQPAENTLWGTSFQAASQQLTCAADYSRMHARMVSSALFGM